VSNRCIEFENEPKIMREAKRIDLATSGIKFALTMVKEERKTT